MGGTRTCMSSSESLGAQTFKLDRRRALRASLEFNQDKEGAKEGSVAKGGSAEAVLRNSDALGEVGVLSHDLGSGQKPTEGDMLIVSRNVRIAATESIADSHKVRKR